MPGIEGFDKFDFIIYPYIVGDLWSYDKEKGVFIVSPEPDLKYIELVPGKQKYLILASDGLWGVMNGQQAVDIVKNYESNSSKKPEDRNCADE